MVTIILKTGRFDNIYPLLTYRVGQRTTKINMFCSVPAAIISSVSKAAQNWKNVEFQDLVWLYFFFLSYFRPIFIVLKEFYSHTSVHCVGVRVASILQSAIGSIKNGCYDFAGLG